MTSNTAKSTKPMKGKASPTSHTYYSQRMKLHYLDGSIGMMRGEKRGEMLDIYFDGQLVSTMTQDQLEQIRTAA